LAGASPANEELMVKRNRKTPLAQQTLQKPQDKQQRAQPPQPPQPQRRQPQPRQPQPPQRQPQAICWKPVLPFSLSNRWKVARLTSAISSSPSSTDCVGEKLNFCGVSALGIADAEAPPASEKVNPAAPNAGTAALVTRFRLEACFDIVASPPYL
jgi:hypothetical protein